MQRILRLGTALALFWTVLQPVAALVFVHLSDPHINVTGSGRFSQEGLPNLRRAIEAIVVIKPAFVIVTGDITELGDEASMVAYQAEVARAGVPVHTVQGNHDNPRNPECFNRAVGPTHPVFDAEGCRFVGLNFDSGEEALALLGQQIADAKAKGFRTVITFAHYPLLAPDAAAFSLAAGFASLTGERATRYLALAREGPILAHLAGHLHSHYDLADPYTGALTLAVPACVDHHAAFRVCTLNDGILSWSVATPSAWPVAVLEGAPPHVQWGTARLEGRTTLRLRTFGPSPVKEATLWLGKETRIDLEPAAANGLRAAVLDCGPLASSYHDLRAHLVDAAGTQADWTWRVLIKGGK